MSSMKLLNLTKTTDNPHVSKMNIDNFTTEKMGDLTHATASKN